MKRIGDALIDAGVISSQQLQEALTFMRPRGLRLGEALIEMGLIGERDLLQSLSDQLGIPTVLDEELIVDPSVVHEIPYVIARKYTIIPLLIHSILPLLTTLKIVPENLFHLFWHHQKELFRPSTAIMPVLRAFPRPLNRFRKWRTKHSFPVWKAMMLMSRTHR